MSLNIQRTGSLVPVFRPHFGVKTASTGVYEQTWKNIEIGDTLLWPLMGIVEKESGYRFEPGQRPRRSTDRDPRAYYLGAYSHRATTLPGREEQGYAAELKADGKGNWHLKSLDDHKLKKALAPIIDVLDVWEYDTRGGANYASTLINRHYPAVQTTTSRRKIKSAVQCFIESKLKDCPNK